MDGNPKVDVNPKQSFVVQPLVVTLIAVCLGIVADQGLSIEFRPRCRDWVLLSTSGVVLWLLARCWKLSQFSGIMLLAAVASLSAAWHHNRWQLFDENEIGMMAAELPQQMSPVALEGIVQTWPRSIAASQADRFSAIPRGDTTQLLLSTKRVRDGLRWQPVSGHLTLRVDGHLLGIAPGDRIRVFGKLHLLAGPRNPWQRDVAAHYRATRQLSLCHAVHPDCVQRLPRNSSLAWPRRMVLQLRRYCRRTLREYLSDENEKLAGALLLGDRHQLPRETIDAFFHTGTIHLLAISGLHVGMLAFVFFVLARGRVLPYQSTLLAVMILAVVYAALTGARAPVIRAVVLIQLTSIGWLSRRTPFAFNSIAAAAIFVLAINPTDLFRPGAQLSFLAVATLAWLNPFLQPPPSTDPINRLVSRTRPWYHRRAKSWSTLR